MLSQYADRLKKMTTPDKEIIDEITLININRAFYLSVLSIIMRIFAIVSFLSNSPGDGIVNIWRTGIIVSHGVLLVLLLIFGGLSYKLRSKDRANALMLIVQYGLALVILFLSAAIASIDQLVTHSINPYIIACMAVGAIFLIKPLYIILIYLSSYIFFYIAMGILQSEPAVLLSNRINGLTSVVLSVFLSSILWRSTVVNLCQKRHIDKQQQELEDKNKSLQYLASTDPLTGLMNRRKFDEEISLEISDIKRYENQSSLLIVDIDNFKDVNDSFGHPVGDALLVEFSLMSKELLRETDIVARIGGEEFAVLLTGTGGEGGRIVAEKIRKNTEKKTFVIDENEINITVSIGLAVLDNETDSYAEVYKCADRALYLSKSKGKNRVDDCLGQMESLPV